MADIAVEPLLSRLAVLADLVMDPSMTAWRKSTFCNGADTCVEARIVGDVVEVRDSKLGDDSPVLKVPAEDWSAFLKAVKGGYLCWPGGLVHYSHVGVDVWDMWLTSDSGTGLQFTDREMDAFAKGVHADEFDLSTLSAGVGSGVDGRSEGASAVLPDFGGGSVPA